MLLGFRADFLIMYIQEVCVINIGIEQFAIDLQLAEVPTIHMDWRSPAGGDKRLIKLLDSLEE